MQLYPPPPGGRGVGGRRSMKPRHVTLGRGLLALTLLATPPAPAQTLARPGWVGSGISTDAWWKHLVLYEIDARTFPSSTGNGTGDLKGIPQRLDYLRSLGVDAILLDSLAPATATPGATTPI